MLKYVAKFIELARFADDYVAINMTKVRKFEDGLKLSIRGKIVGLLLQDIDLMVKTTITIEGEVDDASSIQDVGVKDKRKKIQPSSSSSGKKQKAYVSHGFKDKAKVNRPKREEALGLLDRQGRGHVSIATSLDP